MSLRETKHHEERSYVQSIGPFGARWIASDWPGCAGDATHKAAQTLLEDHIMLICRP